MTETQAAMAFYTDILIVIALIMFIANQVVAFWKEASMEMTLRKVRKMKSGSIETQTVSIKKYTDSNGIKMPAMPEIKIPEFSWGAVLGSLLALVIGISIFVAVYIMFFYSATG